MDLEALVINSYRSIRSLEIELGRVTVVVGPNGSGKTNLYRAMVLLSAAAEGRLARTLLEEGGMPSVLWAGARSQLKRKHEPVRMSIEVTMPPLRYALELGLPPPSTVDSKFTLDPDIKAERVWGMDGKKPVLLAERKANTAWVRGDQGQRESYPAALYPGESMLSQLKDPRRFPVLGTARAVLGAWRFYHHVRTDHDAPVRERRAGVRTPVVSPDGSDLAAALQTIVEIGFIEDLDEAVDRAFPGATLAIQCDGAARFEVAMQMPGIKRPLSARELSDGTLRYLCLLAALLSPRPPPLLALNEPETSLHVDLLEPLGMQIARAARHSQILVCTHSDRLARAIGEHIGTTRVALDRSTGETTALVTTTTTMAPGAAPDATVRAR